MSMTMVFIHVSSFLGEITIFVLHLHLLRPFPGIRDPTGAPRPRHGRAGAPRRGSAAAGGRSSRGQSRPGCCRSPGCPSSL